MRWPADHPIHTDPPLTRWRGDAEAVCPHGRAVAVLRHVPGRRVASLVETPDGAAVLKLFASPRARGNERRLRLLRPATGALVPRPLGAGPEGHAGLLEYVPGRPLTDLADADLIGACAELGRSLARLHGAAVVLDRAWTAREEVEALHRRSAGVGRTRGRPAPDVLVPAHRDLHPAQVVVGPDGVRLIDLDEAAMAPAGLDVGNFLAHLDRESAVGDRDPDETNAACRAFLDGYGGTPRDLAWWRQIALARLAVLAVQRHGRPDWAEALRALVC